MATDNERREVARRLREDASCSESSPREVVESYLGIEYDGEDVLEESYKSESLLHLADLIDPTCHVIPGKEAVAELKDGTRLTGVLLSCGHAVFGVSAKDMPRFCCECGARITNEVGDD